MGPNQQMGAATGAVVGGLLGNTIGRGDGRFASTAIGTFLGTVVGGEVGKSMDTPSPVVHKNAASVQSPYGVCSEIANEGARSSCQRGVADRLRQKQRQMETDAYRKGYGR